MGTLARANNRGNKPVKAKKKKTSFKSKFQRRSKLVSESNELEITPVVGTDEINQIATEGQTHEQTTINIFNVQKSRPNVFQPILAYLYSVCSQSDRSSFPFRPDSDTYHTPSYNPTPAMVSELICSFKEWVPEDVAKRHNLNENVVAEDLGRCIKKASREYIRSLKGRTGHKFTV